MKRLLPVLVILALLNPARAEEKGGATKCPEWKRIGEMTWEELEACRNPPSWWQRIDWQEIWLSFGAAIDTVSQSPVFQLFAAVIGALLGLVVAAYVIYVVLGNLLLLLLPKSNMRFKLGRAIGWFIYGWRKRR